MKDKVLNIRAYSDTTVALSIPAAADCSRFKKHLNKRHGTLNLFAALNVATGAIQSKTTATKKRPGFQAFLDEVVAEVSADREVHIMLDNYCTHKKSDDWLAAHPNVNFHFTPASASCLKQVAIWFGIMSRKTLRGASFSSIC
jgi:hypothetical protein